ncbi:MAG: hypothetical protein R3Y62_00900 [Eubacteriales bacterium]
MELKLDNRDYVPDGTGGFTQLTGDEAKVAKALFLLTAKRGYFPLLPTMGSQLHLLGREVPSARDMVALQYANEALEGSGLEAVSATVTPTGDDCATVAITVQADTDYWNLEVNI